MGNPSKKGVVKILYASFVSTPIGRMISLSDDSYLYLLEFLDCRGLEKEIEKMRRKYNARITHEETVMTQNLTNKLALCFKEEPTHFTTPIHTEGSAVQKKYSSFYVTFRLGRQ